MKKSLILAAVLSTPALFGQSDDAGNGMLAGLTALRAADHTAAQAAFSQVVVAEPDNAKAWYYRGVSRLQAGDAEAAVNDLGRALRLAPTDGNVLIRHAEACMAMGWSTMAQQDLEQVLALRGDGPVAEHALLLLGELSFGAGDLITAKAHYDRLIHIAPYNVLGLVDRGIILIALGQNVAAIADLEQAIALDPSLDMVHGQLALAHHRLGHRMEACQAWQQALDAGDNSVQESLLVFCE